jgi:hypothetical protein
MLGVAEAILAGATEGLAADSMRIASRPANFDLNGGGRRTGRRQLHNEGNREVQESRRRMPRLTALNTTLDPSPKIRRATFPHRKSSPPDVNHERIKPEAFDSV